MAAVFALLAAGSFGVGDFLGGLATRRGTGNPVPVVAYAHVAGLALAAGLLVVFPGDFWSADLLIGAAAGTVGAVGLAFLYRGLAKGRMGLVAPLTAVLAAVIPATWGVLRGERPSTVAAMGVVLGLVAIPLVSWEGPTLDVVGPPERGVLPPGFLDGLIAGIGFGAFFILIDFASDASGAVPLVGARLVTVPVFLGVALLVAGGLAVGTDVRRLSLWSGVFDMAANAWFLAAVRTGLITEVVVLTALAPAGTVALARVIEHERLSRVQWAGLPLAVAGVAMIGLGG